MRKAALTLLAAALLLTAGSAFSTEADSVPRVPYSVGEKLEFSINWTVGNIGTAWMHVAGIDTFRSEQVFRIEAGANSNKTIDLFYPVRDRFTSLIDTDELYPHKFIKRQKEGRHEENREYVFLQDQLIRFDLVRGDTVDIVPQQQDQLSIFYYFRTLDLQVGQGLLLENFVDKQGNPLKVAVQRTEWVEVPAGRFFCFVVEPYIKSGGLFKHKGNLQIWITSDRHRIPVKVSSQLNFGKIVVLLERYKLGKGAG
ncbi:MAG: DUF3108 domain-containing protein [Candidatus Glassbacteria bacterium]|nr:DUF3108 domain-containing protein [Candidatus Glassbacteria bacterium]